MNLASFSMHQRWIVDNGANLITTIHASKMVYLGVSLKGFVSPSPFNWIHHFKAGVGSRKSLEIDLEVRPRDLRMSTHTGEVLHVNGAFDFRAFTPVTLALASKVRTAEEAVISWLLFEEAMVYP